MFLGTVLHMAKNSSAWKKDLVMNGLIKIKITYW